MAFRALTRRESLTLLTSAACLASSVPAAEPPLQWVCPMDPDVRAPQPDRCRKCGMRLVAGLPTPEEYPVDMAVLPTNASPGDDVTLRFRIRHPRTGRPAKLHAIHEKLFHLFLVSRDLSVFRHEHPVQQDDGSFLHRTVLPIGGMYRVLCDFYPENATPQMIPKTLLVRGAGLRSRIQPDLTPQRAENVTVSLRFDPAKPLAGTKTMLFFTLEPSEGLEQYLGAWGHLLAASQDTIDLIHSHPAWEDSGPQVQFNIIFPRPGIHRVWVQFQRKGVVNTAAFNIPVGEL